MSTIVKNTKYDILTPNGFEDFYGVRELEHDKVLEIKLSNNQILRCSLSHPFMLDGRIIKANELYVGCQIDTAGDVVFITSIELILEHSILYDVINSGRDHVLIVDGIISHNCDFIASGHSVVDGSTIEWYKATYVKEPLERQGFDGNLLIWQYPNYTKSYIVAADVARGDGSDFSAAHVIDIETLEQVAEYRGKLSTTDFGNFLVSLSSQYNDALLAIENAGVGWAVIQVVLDRKYKNLYYSVKQDHIIDEGVHLVKGYDLMDKSKLVPGFSMNTRTRPLVVSKVELYLRERTPIIHSIRLLNEMFTFIWNGQRAEAQQGYNDDLFMSFGIALWVRDTAIRLRQAGIDLTKRSLQNINKPVINTKPKLPGGWEWGTGKNKESLKWLLDKR